MIGFIPVGINALFHPPDVPRSIPDAVMKYAPSLLLPLLFLPLNSCSNPEDEADDDRTDTVVTELRVCREHCGENDGDSVLALRYEDGVAITIVDTIAIGSCISLPLSAFSDSIYTRADSITFGYVKDAREWWGPPRVRQLTLLTASLALDSVTLGCR